MEKWWMNPVRWSRLRSPRNRKSEEKMELKIVV